MRSIKTGYMRVECKLRTEEELSDDGTDVCTGLKEAFQSCGEGVSIVKTELEHRRDRLEIGKRKESDFVIRESEFIRWTYVDNE